MGRKLVSPTLAALDPSQRQARVRRTSGEVSDPGGWWAEAGGLWASDPTQLYARAGARSLADLPVSSIEVAPGNAVQRY